MKEQKVPRRFRSQETDRIFAWLRAGESCQVIGIGSVGKSNFLRFLQQKEIRRARLGADGEPFLLVYVDANKLLDASEAGLWELMLHQVLVELSDRGLGNGVFQEIDDLYQRAIAPATRHVALRWLDRAASILCNQLGMKLVFLFDEFDDLYRSLPAAVFKALRALRDDHKYKLMYVIATRTELARLRKREEIYEAFEELVTPNLLWLFVYSEQDARDMLRRLAARYQSRPGPKQIRMVLAVSGGHPGLIRAVFPRLPEVTGDVPEMLLADRQVQEEVRRIWQSLPEEEQKALAALVHGVPLPPSAEAFARLQQKGLVGGKWSEPGEVFSPLLKRYIQKEKPFAGARIRIDREQRSVWIDNRNVENIPVLEFKFLEYLDKRHGQVCRRDQIARYLYPGQKLAGVSTNAIDSIVKRLRKRLETNPRKPAWILTVHGVGFRLADGEPRGRLEKSKPGK